MKNKQPRRLGDNWQLKSPIISSTISKPIQISCISGSEVTLESPSLSTQFIQLPVNVEKNFKVTLWYGDSFGSTFVILGNQGTEIARMFGTPARQDFIFINNEYRF